MNAVIHITVRDDRQSINIIRVPDEPLNLEFMQQHVGCSQMTVPSIEVVRLPFLEHAVVICDEEGKLKHLPFCLICNDYDIIVGDVLIVAEGLNKEKELDFLPLSSRGVALVLMKLPTLLVY